MAATIDQNFINQFSDNLHHLLSQKGSKLRNVFPVKMANGEKHFFDRLGAFTATEIVSRLQPVNLQDAAHSRRMATLKAYEASTSLDSVDEFKMLIDPTNDYVIELANAQGKNYDDVVIAALLGNAATGKDGSGSTALGAGQVIAAGGTGLTVAKFDQALRMLQAAEVDISVEDVVLIVNAAGLEDLHGDTSNKLTSFDFQNRKPLADGSKLMYRGVELIWCERLPDVSAGVTGRAILCTKNALKVAMAHDMQVKTADLPEKQFSLLVHTKMMFGAVRMEELRVVDIQFTK